MGRPKRRLAADVIYHVTIRGNNQRPIFTCTRDREQYLRCLAWTSRKAGVRVLGYCLMGNHVHLLLETPDANLDTMMWRLSTEYARWFNRRHGRRNHLFGRRYHDVIISDQRQFAAVMAYVASNPVRAGLCGRPSEWPWSSHNAMVGSVAAPAFLAIGRARELMGDDNYEKLFL